MSSAAEHEIRHKAMWEAVRQDMERAESAVDTLIIMTFARFMQHLHEEKMFKMYGHRRNNYLFPTQQADRARLGVDMAYGEDTSAGRLTP